MRRIIALFNAITAENIAFAENDGHNRRMKSGENIYIWQQQDWPHWLYDLQRLMGPLGQVHRAQGNLLGRMQTLGLGLREQATLQVLTEDVVKTSEIEGEHVNPEAVRSSIARRLGVDIGALAPADRHVDGVVDMGAGCDHQSSPGTDAGAIVRLACRAFPDGI